MSECSGNASVNANSTVDMAKSDRSPSFSGNFISLSLTKILSL